MRQFTRLHGLGRLLKLRRLLPALLSGLRLWLRLQLTTLLKGLALGKRSGWQTQQGQRECYNDGG
jgi:hypothetical protein